MTQKLYFLDQDGDCHWHLVEADKRKEWEQWKAIDSENPESWKTPTFARMINSAREIEFLISSPIPDAQNRP